MNDGSYFDGQNDQATSASKESLAQANAAGRNNNTPLSAGEQGTVANLNNLYAQYLSSSGYTPASAQAAMQAANNDPNSQIAKIIESASNAAQQTVNAQVTAPSLWQNVAGGIALASSVGALTAGAGAMLAPAIGAAGTALGGTAGSIANGAIAGGIGGAANAGLTGQNIGKGVLMGAVGGGLGSGASSYLGNALNNATGIGTAASNAIVKGAVGAGTGALGAALNGTSVAGGAITNGISQAANGYVGSATGIPILGTLAGTVAGGTIGRDLAAKYNTPSAAAPATTSAPATATNTALPTLPGQSAPTGVQTGTPPATTPTPNIGSYSGYTPRQQTNPNINYATYGQGPEAQFFTNPNQGT